MCVEQIIEYEDFDNTTDGYQVNEYEYEEEDERYGPAEREREFSLNAEVRAELQRHAVELFSLHLHSSYMSASFCSHSEYARKRRKRRAWIFRAGEKNIDTRPLRVCDPRCVVAALKTC